MVRRRPRWRGGHPGPSALCVYILAKRSFETAARLATRRGDPGAGPGHLLHGRRSSAASSVTQAATCSPPAS
jgi:hypothetical protein